MHPALPSNNLHIDALPTPNAARTHICGVQTNFMRTTANAMRPKRIVCRVWKARSGLKRMVLSDEGGGGVEEEVVGLWMSSSFLLADISDSRLKYDRKG